MRCSDVSSLIVALSALSVSATQLSAKRQNNGCYGEFAQDGDSYTSTSNITHRVSQGRVCTPGSSNQIELCNVQSAGLVQEKATFEIRNTSFVDPNIFRTLLVFVASDSTLNASIEDLYGRPPYLNQTLDEGQAGFLAFTAYMHCVEGTLCHAEANVTEPTWVRGCFPSRDGLNYMDTLNGTTTFVTTDPDSARELGLNPAVQTENNYLAELEEDDEGVAGALDVVLAKWYAISAVSLAIFLLGF